MQLEPGFMVVVVFISKYHDDLVMRTVEGKLCEEHLVTREKYSKKRLDSRRNGGMSPKFPSLKLESKNLVDKSLKANEKEEKKSKKGDGDKVREGMEKGSKKNEVDSQKGLLRVGLDMC